MDILVFAGVGERTREGNDLLREMIESGVINYGDKFKEEMAKGKWDLEKAWTWKEGEPVAGNIGFRTDE